MNFLTACLMTISVCLLIGEGSGATNCKIGNCACNGKTINVRKPGSPAVNLEVCCPPADGDRCSKYVRAGSATVSSNAYCTCDYTRISGSCLRGSQCNGILGIRGQKFNGMPVCCPSLAQKIVSFRKINANNFNCQCSAPAPQTNPAAWSGTCWKGKQCDSCDSKYVGGVNGLKLCCANCVKKGLIINAGQKSCDCNN